MFGSIGKFMNELPLLKEQLKEIKISTSRGGGAVTIVMNGLEEVVRVDFGPAAAAAMRSGHLNGMLADAFNEALRESRRHIREVVARETGFTIPHIPGLF